MGGGTPLAELFWRGRADAPPIDESGASRLEEALAEALAAGSAAWPDLPLEAERFAAHLAAVLPAATGASDLATQLRGLRTGDLYLACACLGGDPAALRALEELVWGEATRATVELRQGNWLSDEVQQTLRHRLLFPEGETPPRLAGYEGKGSLSRWLGVAARRTALNLLRRRRKDRSLDESRLARLPSPAESPEIEVLRRQYRGDFEAAIRDAFGALERARDRNLLRLYYFDGVGLDRLGELYRVHPSTVSRWIAALRQWLFHETRRLLAERLRLSAGELDSLLRLVGGDLDVTLSQILKDPA